MLILYGATGAGSVAPQALLSHLEVPFELKLISFDANEHQSKEFLAVNPRGQIPALVLEDNSVLTESLAIMLHVADCHPTSGLSPAPGTSERAQVYRWMSFVATGPLILPTAHHKRFAMKHEGRAGRGCVIL